MSTRANDDTSAQHDANGCFVRVLWLASNLALLVFGVLILRDGKGPLSMQSIAYWVAAAGAIGLRYLEVTRLDGTTLDGKPASRKHWVRYTTRLLPIAVLGWLAALALG